VRRRRPRSADPTARAAHFVDRGRYAQGVTKRRAKITSRRRRPRPLRHCEWLRTGGGAEWPDPRTQPSVGGGGGRSRAAGKRRRSIRTVRTLAVSAISPDAKTSAQNFATRQFDLLHYAIFAFRSAAAVLRVCVARVCV